MSVGLMVHVNHIQWKHQHSGRNTHELWVISHIWSYHSYRCHRKWNSATCLCERIGDTTDAHTHTQSHKHTQTHWNWVQLGKERVKVRLSTETHVVNPKSKQKEWNISQTQIQITHHPHRHSEPPSLTNWGWVVRQMLRSLYSDEIWFFSIFHCACILAEWDLYSHFILIWSLDW